MGYSSRFELHAIDPHTVEEVVWSILPRGYRTRVEDLISKASGWPVDIDEKTGDLFRGAEMKFYEYEDCLKAMSKECQEAIWVLHIIGEESGDIRACYAYRGESYEAKMPPWVPPPPDMERLPPIDRDFYLPDHDPPSLTEGLQIALKHLQHSSSCPAMVPGRTFMEDSTCTCHVKQVKEALEGQAISDRVAPR